MKAAGVALQGALAVVALVAAFFVWQREPEGSPGEVTVLDVPARSLERLRYEDEVRFVELYRDATDRDAFWLRLGTKPAKPIAGPAAADGGVAATPPQPSEPVPPPRELRANDVAVKLFSRFAPLHAQRSLGDLDAKKLEEVGLAHSERRLTLTLGGKPEVFALASPTGGWGTPYLRRESDGRVFLLGPSLLPDLDAAASRLVDRRLHTFEAGEFDRVVVTTGGVSRAYQASGMAGGTVRLAPVETPDTPDEFARNWHDRVWRLVPLDFLGRGETPTNGAPQPQFQVTYQRGERILGELTVARATDGTYYARTEHAQGWARLQAGIEPWVEEAAKVSAVGVH
ncbi:hypothetical protein DRW03_12155 [Corallococcus sp. H22C18031201]|nr:hypothetical protein DRW03_12155 [Corallococcus sp. H22C18031201]